MDALYKKLEDAIEKSNKTYDLSRIESAYELAKKRMKDRCGRPATHIYPTQLR